ncbi:MAG TPA: ferrous iron transporter B [Gammaproteobacteria bacterium]|nr:ferrous iron transporter B [Gammaproteobacteria bacterium]
MVIGATSLSMVRDELFATMAETQQYLEQFLEARDNGALLQQAVTNLQQIKGILSLVELTGAELLAEETRALAMDIPVGATDDRNDQLTAINNALHVLRSYLEQLEVHWMEMPELLLPAINKLRTAGQKTPLPESFFFAARVDVQRPSSDKGPLARNAESQALSRRLRHMYQIGLLAVIRDENPQASLRLMMRALLRLDRLYTGHPSSHLYWVAAGALESQADAQLLVKKSRKQLFARVDREIKLQCDNPDYVAPRGLIKDLLYLIALANSNGEIAEQVRSLTNLPALPFTDHMLDDEYQRLSGPGQNVLRSLSVAIREELTAAKDILDLIERGTAQNSELSSLHSILAKVEKTLSMVGLSGASNALKRHLNVVESWADISTVESGAMLALADTLLYVEGMVAGLERGERQAKAQNDVPVDENESFAKHQLLEARIVVNEEAKSGLSLAKRAITSYLESDGDKMHLANVPSSLLLVRGGLVFLDQERAAEQVGACAHYIQTHMLEATTMPSEQQLDTLADALTSLEYYLEGGVLLHAKENRSVLDLADESLRALDVQV